MQKWRSWIERQKSQLIIALDPHIEQIPSKYRKNYQGVQHFLEDIIAVTAPYCVGYKFNLAFFEYWGSKGWQVLEYLITKVPYTHLLIADAKRCDIGSSSTYYAKAFLAHYPFDAITLVPWLGEKSWQPFLAYEDKVLFFLGLPSENTSWQLLKMVTDKNTYFYQAVVRRLCQIEAKATIGFVVGATTKEEDQKFFHHLPMKHPFLVVGLGAQQGQWQLPPSQRLQLFVVGRSILFADAIETAAKKWQQYTWQFSKS